MDAIVAPPAVVEPTTHFRSTWLSSSIRALKKRELWGAYLGYLPGEHHEAVEMHVAGMWLPIEVAEAHYEACDRLELSSQELFAIGAEVTERVHGTILSTVVRMARTAGANPWMALERTPRLWQRIWVGGAVTLYEHGPKEAQVEILRWGCARYRYIQLALRGVLYAVVDMFCRTVYVKQVTDRCGEDRLSYLLSWA